MTVTIWHNPGCSKSRATLKLLLGRGLEPVIRLYKNDAPSVDEINQVLEFLNIPAIDLIRSNDPLFASLNLSTDSDPHQLIAAIAANPTLIERPVVITAKGAAIGRPPENVLKILPSSF